MTNRKEVIAIAVVAVALAVTFGLTLRGVTAVGSTRTEGQTVPLQGAKSARVELVMDSGELRLGRGASRLLDAAFTYNVDAWEPELDYRVISREGVLRVEQGDTGGPFPVVYGDTLNVWDVVLTPNIPLDLRLDLGSADSTVMAGGLNLLQMDITGDGGDTVVDLSGPVARDLDVRVATGGGDLTLTLPTEAGLRVVIASDSGSISAGDLRPTGTAYVNERFGSTPLTVTVTIDSAGGDITVLQAESDSPAPSPIVAPVPE